ncbi:MAG: hypothetical protein EOP22_17285 [Hyphomicrobiales bacterium]|nr:MAG: hypothetical protein EOP22_17285 [Hyphomicrobiales bacterium]
MQGLSRQQTLEDLRTRIEKVERRPALSHGSSKVTADDGAFALPGKSLHEIFVDSHRDAGASLGFALGVARSLLSRERPAIVYLQMSSDTAETGLPYATGIASFGVDPEAIVLVRTTNIVDLLWAAEETLACRAVAAVIADIGSDPKALDFTASRRLGMRSAESDGAFLMLRYGLGRTASAARFRWHIAPQRSSEMTFDRRSPGNSRWRLKLEKGLWDGKPEMEWHLGWTKNGFDIFSPDRDSSAGIAPLPAYPFAALGDRLPKTA